jgi:2-dehydropantoate 2-reductase
MHTESAARSIGHLFESSKALALSFQNGLENEDEIGRIIGKDRVLAGLTLRAASILGPGVVSSNTMASPALIGDLQGASARSQRLAESFTAPGLPTHASQSIIHEKCDERGRQSAARRYLCHPRAEEGGVAGNFGGDRRRQRQGDCLVESEAHEMFLAVGHGDERGAPTNKSSMCQDILNRRPTEVQSIYGKVIKLGDKHGINTPMLQAFLAMVKGLESHYVRLTA